ncbi:hypothetical protein QCA50_007846 [Cerrena zonata]|uniref:Uncharacterized protein n=1 Tax=Cerrena zonata TaxID=2478898 RepID=A0AAW0GJE9_9APHY
MSPPILPAGNVLSSSEKGGLRVWARSSCRQEEGVTKSVCFKRIKSPEAKLKGTLGSWGRGPSSRR